MFGIWNCECPQVLFCFLQPGLLTILVPLALCLMMFPVKTTEWLIWKFKYDMGVIEMLAKQIGERGRERVYGVLAQEC